MEYGVTQHEHYGHLTTEQLSAFLDKQLTPQEQAVFDAHISTCPQCQQALAELRSTVALLRAMPRVEVPRSFILPTVIRPVAVQPRRVDTEPPRQRVLHHPLRRTVRAVSTLAAVLGFLFILSGFLPSIHFAAGGGGNTAAPVYAPSSSQGNTSTRTVPGITSPNTHGTPQVGKATSPATKTPVSAQPTPTATQAANKTTLPPANQAPTLPPVLDLGRTEGRLSLGFLLLLFSIIGLITTRRRRGVVY